MAEIPFLYNQISSGSILDTTFPLRYSHMQVWWFFFVDVDCRNFQAGKENK
jgi:hypothetical protein